MARPEPNSEKKISHNTKASAEKKPQKIQASAGKSNKKEGKVNFDKTMVIPELQADRVLSPKKQAKPDLSKTMVFSELAQEPVAEKVAATPANECETTVAVSAQKIRRRAARAQERPVWTSWILWVIMISILLLFIFWKSF